MKTMTIERVLAFNGLDVLVARDEGLFEAEGVDLRIATLPPSAPGGPNRCMPRELFGQFPTVPGEPGSTTRACS